MHCFCTQYIFDVFIKDGCSISTRPLQQKCHEVHMYTCVHVAYTNMFAHLHGCVCTHMFGREF